MPPAAARTMTIVVWFQAIVPSASGDDVGTVNAETSKSLTATSSQFATALHEFSHLVAEDGLDDLVAVGSSLGERFGQMSRLFRGDFGRHGRLVGIDDSFDDHRAGRVQ